MSIISLPYQYQTGQVISAANEMANLNAIVNDYNGNITNSNLSSSIAITDSHLNQITTASKVSGTALTGLASIPSGAGVIPAANLTYVNVQYPYVKVSETQSSGTSGGTGTSGSWQTRVLNTLDIDTASISSLGSNQLTLPAGSYMVRASSPFFYCESCQTRLQNITATSTLLIGTSEYTNASPYSGVRSHIIGYFTLSTSSALSIQYQITQAETNGLGQAGSFGTEVYTIAEFTKVQ